MENRTHVVIGAGPAGLTAAYELAKHGHTGVIIEADTQVGGISRTVERDGYRFDLGGHRFFTKVQEVRELWNEMLGEAMLVRPRLSRIFYEGCYYQYPLNARNALKNMGWLQAGGCAASYLRSKCFPYKEPRNYEQWVVNQFGRKLFEMFFRSYTEKVWGMPCSEISADWAAQRIKTLSLGKAIHHAIFGQNKSSSVTSLVEQFHYPRLGPGQLWENCANQLATRGWSIYTGMQAERFRLGEDGRIASVLARTREGEVFEFESAHVFSSMPLGDLVRCMTPAAPNEVIAATQTLCHRDFLTVALAMEGEGLFPDNWLYIHSNSVRVGRIQNFANWSPEMVPAGQTCLGLEYFVNEGDDIWRMPDEQLVQLAQSELVRIGLTDKRHIKGYVVRVAKAYPVYAIDYQNRIRCIRGWLDGISNLSCVGRNGQHRYNNQDHSMVTALIAARNVVHGLSKDPWAVNQDAEYHEIANTKEAQQV